MEFELFSRLSGLPEGVEGAEFFFSVNPSRLIMRLIFLTSEKRACESSSLLCIIRERLRVITTTDSTEELALRGYN